MPLGAAPNETGAFGTASERTGIDHLHDACVFCASSPQLGVREDVRMRKAVIAIVLSVLAALLSANLNTVAHAQGDLVAPSNVAAQNTGNPGEVLISWDAVPGAAYYRIGWVAYADVEPIIAVGGDWLERFAFIDIQNRGQTEHLITRLTPGVQYAFIVASNDGRYGIPQWPPATGWRFLNLTEALASQAAMGTASVNVSWNAVPGAAYYRIGWVVYEDVTPIIAAGGDWLEHFAFIDIANRGQTTHTITRLTPGVQYAFIVAGNDGRYGTPQWPPASAWQFLTPGASPPGMQQPEPEPSQTDQPACPGPEWTTAPRPTSTVPGDYDADDDGLIGVANLAQLDAMRYDPSGGGSPHSANLATYLGAFPNAIAGMGCPEEGCNGYELVADLDFDTNGNGQADAGDTYWNDGAGWLPIWGYRGTFDGGGHTIANLYIFSDNTSSVGLFGSGFSGTINGVALASVNVTGIYAVGGLIGDGRGTISESCVSGTVIGGRRQGGSTGGLAGTVSNSSSGSGRIVRSYATASVSGGENVGGLVGSAENGSSISGSYATGAVSGGENVGGLVGAASEIYNTSDSYANISDSYATGAVSGGYYVGGLVGSGSNISDSYATGDVSGGSGGDYVGGLVGLVGFRGSISDSYATGAVSGGSDGDNVGGLVGSAQRSSSISGSYATGAVSGGFGGGGVGGLVGSAQGDSSISGSYATGAVSGGFGGGGVGGLAGSASNISGSYATGDVSGGGGVGGLAGGASNISGSYATGAVSGESNVGGLVGSASNISDSYATGAVSGGDSVGGLAGYGDNISDSYATGAVSGGIFVGGLAGDFSEISGSHATGTVSGGGYVGGLAGFGDSVTASYATGAVNGSADYVGGLIGSFGGLVIASYATGAVSGANDVGGLVGGSYGSSSGDIQASYATGAVSGTFRVGGLAGRAGFIWHSYAIGQVSGTALVGGLVGDNPSGRIFASYWDTETTGQSHSDGGVGKTTSELQSLTGYTGIYATWNVDLDNLDRDDDLMTGGDDPWDFGTSGQYPVLKYGGLDPAQQRR